ncbi:MAG: hypothetical protein K0R54_102 [Clostridiaceae bacterium]|jgi:hypothetical protein|nr:hypothetical protein [Clostridiaceae bacterium]
MIHAKNMTKKKLEWIECQLKQFPGCREDVIRFIGDILFFSPNSESDDIRLLFHAGYCYYFAKILMDAFDGEICWHKGYGHIVWRDGLDYCYDIEGVFYDYNDNEIVPICVLGESLEDFRHRGYQFKEKYDITNTPYLNILLSDSVWHDTDFSIKKIKETFEKLEESRKSKITAKELILILELEQKYN